MWSRQRVSASSAATQQISLEEEELSDAFPAPREDLFRLWLPVQVCFLHFFKFAPKKPTTIFLPHTGSERGAGEPGPGRGGRRGDSARHECQQQERMHDRCRRGAARVHPPWEQRPDKERCAFLASHNYFFFFSPAGVPSANPARAKEAGGPAAQQTARIWLHSLPESTALAAAKLVPPRPSRACGFSSGIDSLSSPGHSPVQFFFSKTFLFLNRMFFFAMFPVRDSAMLQPTIPTQKVFRGLGVSRTVGRSRGRFSSTPNRAQTTTCQAHFQTIEDSSSLLRARGI